MEEIDEVKEKNIKEKCFVIMPISTPSSYPEGHFQKIYEQIFKPAIEDAGYEALRIDEDNICDSIIDKIFTAIQDCPMALCDLSSRNPNVLYELGIRQAYDKPVVLVQDDSTEKIFDISGINTKFYKSNRLYENILSAREEIKNALVANKNNKSGTNSLVKTIKTKKAILDKTNITEEETTKFLLNSIVESIDSIQKNLNKSDVNERVINYRDFMKSRVEAAITNEIKVPYYLSVYDEVGEIMADKGINENNKGALVHKLESCIVDVNRNKYICEEEKQEIIDKVNRRKQIIINC